MENQGSEQNGVEKHHWGGRGWNQDVGPRMTMITRFLRRTCHVAVQVPVWWSLDFNWTALYVHTHLIICIRTIGGAQSPPRVVQPMIIIITDLRRT